jgi:enterochelin esterase family protein
MEYLVELVHPDGRTELTVDPTNPHSAPGPFGAKSVIEFPGYRQPFWLDIEPASPPGLIEDLAFDDPELGDPMQVRLWSWHGVRRDDRLPLLIVNDGIEYADLAGLVVMLDRLTGDGSLPPMRAALLHPVRRDEHYTASPLYARVLTERLLPFLHAHAPIVAGRHMRVGMGASLGGLAMLHAHRSQPSAFGGLFLQSASLFHHRYDRYEIAFEHFQRIRHFMDRMHATRADWRWPIPVGMTCGKVEMNLANNRAASLVLRAQGYDVDFREVPDGHNWIGWRDAWQPGLITLLRKLWL